MWQLIPLSQYIQERAATPEPEKRLWRHIWDHFFSKKNAVETVEVEFDSPPLQSAPTRLLDWVAPRPDWVEACRKPPEHLPVESIPESNTEPEIAEITTTPLFVDEPPIFHSLSTAGERVHHELDLELAEWANSRVEGSGIRVVLAAPHSGTHNMVRGWVEYHGYLLCPPITNDQIWDGFDEWLAQLKQSIQSRVEAEQSETRLVLIGLERYFVRHHNGLGFLRRLMDYLATEAPSSLIVCDSWAWAYLRDAIHLDAMVRPPLTLARHSGHALSEWLTELSSGSHHRTFTFRRGSDALFSVGAERSEDESPSAYENFFAKLAEVSRGNPGIAQALWRNSMSIDATVNVDQRAQQEAQDDPGYTVWVQPINGSLFPIVPITFTNDDALILQTLLIHNGLSVEMLRQVLPLSSSHITRRLQVMRNANLTRNQDEVIEITPLGYLPVRTFLREHGFFVDDL